MCHLFNCIRIHDHITLSLSPPLERKNHRRHQSITVCNTITWAKSMLLHIIIYTRISSNAVMNVQAHALMSLKCRQWTESDRNHYSYEAKTWWCALEWMWNHSKEKYEPKDSVGPGIAGSNSSSFVFIAETVDVAKVHNQLDYGLKVRVKYSFRSSTCAISLVVSLLGISRPRKHFDCNKNMDYPPLSKLTKITWREHAHTHKIVWQLVTVQQFRSNHWELHLHSSLLDEFI